MRAAASDFDHVTTVRASSHEVRTEQSSRSYQARDCHSTPVCCGKSLLNKSMGWEGRDLHLYGYQRPPPKQERPCKENRKKKKKKREKMTACGGKPLGFGLSWNQQKSSRMKLVLAAFEAAIASAIAKAFQKSNLRRSRITEPIYRTR